MKKAMININEERKKDIQAMNDPRNVRQEFKGFSLEECQSYCQKDRLPFDACFLNLTSDLNVSASIRTLHLLGVDTIYILGKKKLDRRALVGAEFYSNLKFLGGLQYDDFSIDENVFLNMLSIHEDYFPIFVEMGGLNLTSIDWKNILQKDAKTLYRPFLIYGNENRGIGENILKLCEKLPRSIIVSIPMLGVLRSLNVSVSVAISSWDLIKNIYTEKIS
jgi:tRNA G18 (ribose-2'-O)-methylase SpoU